MVRVNHFRRTVWLILIIQTLACSLVTIHLGAQNDFSVKKYTVDNGLPHNQVTYKEE